MNIEINFKKIPSDLTLFEYFLLSLLVQNKEATIEYINSRTETPEGTQLKDTIISLGQELYIRATSNDMELRKKALDLFPEEKSNISFKEFWDKYHQIVKEWNKTDKDRTERYWKRLSNSEKKLAYDNIESYYNSCRIIRGRRTARKAVYYIGDKLFKDEFGDGYENNISDPNKMI